jgi:chromosome segregation ATPase
VDSVSAREEPLAQLRRLEAELERYREHAQRTSKLFLSVTKYVEWVRESARSEAELALSKARARVEKLDRASRKLEETELKLRQAQDDLAHLQVVTEETRARLSAFLAAGLQALDAGASAPVGIEDTLLERLASGSVSPPSEATPVESPLS